jgi:alkylation response protein AidB-like acyl-CoA dehydrogenase
MSRTTTKVLAVVAVLAVVGGLAYAGLAGRREAASTANGTGLTYDGRWYWASSDEVAASALGAPVASAVAFQDTTADLRAIEGFPPDVALAALLPPLTGGRGGPRWTFVSTDQGRGTNPTAYADSAAVLAGDD